MRAVRVLVGVALVVVGAAAPAAADPAGPTDYRSEVTAIDPAVDGVTATIVGGDAFLEVTNTGPHTVTVLGYDDEPYLRFGPDGTVAANTASPAYYLNNDRYAQVSVPATAGADLDPVWEPVATGGTYSWHDHRVHWMSPQPPPQIDTSADREQSVFDWRVPMSVDGDAAAATITGDLAWLPAPSILPTLAMVALGLLMLVLWTRPVVLLPIVAMVAAAAGALAVGLGEASIQPAGIGATGVGVVLPAVALVAGLVGLVLLRARRDLAAVAGLAAAATLAGWLFSRLSALTAPVLPTALAPGVERLVTAAVLGLTVSAAALLVRAASPAPAAAD